MKRVVFIAICIVGFLGFTSCGSTAPCGLSQKVEKHQLDNLPSEILVAETIVE